jgi:hypothetical protein
MLRATLLQDVAGAATVVAAGAATVVAAAVAGDVAGAAVVKLDTQHSVSKVSLTCRCLYS